MPYISDLDLDAPDGDVDDGVDLLASIHELKTTIQDSFPNIDGPVLCTVADLYQIVTCRSAIQTQIDSHNSSLSTQALSPQVYSGNVDAHGTLHQLTRTANWGVNQISTGYYQVIHNLGTNNYATVISPDWSQGSRGNIPCCAVSQDVSSFTVSFYWPHSTPPMFTDHGFTFHLATQ